MKNSLIVLFLLWSLASFSQGEANNWYFGYEAGISFNGSKVSVLTNSKSRAFRACATMSNSNGRLLFYTNGESVWDSTHSIAPNGIGLNYGTVLILPRPSHPGKYYIFTSNNIGSKNGLAYSEFDMSLNSGKGDIDLAKINIKIMTPVVDRLTATIHSNGKDFWVISQLSNSDKIYAWLVTSSGINPNPVISNTGLYIKSQEGCMKVSPDGTKLAFTNFDIDSSVIADFDANNGKVSNSWHFIPGYNKNSFSIEFSANSKYLYIGKMHYSEIHQFYAKAQSLQKFKESQIQMDSFPTEISGMQLGKDGKIYLSSRFSGYLGVIHAPDSVGKKCRLRLNYHYLNGKMCGDMLPQFVQSYFNPHFISQGTCLGDTAWFSLGESIKTDSILWNFDDASSKYNTAKGNRVFHIFSAAGTYKVRSIAFIGKYKDTAYFDVVQKSYIGKLNELDKEVYKCFDDTITLKISNANSQKIKWSTNSDSLNTRVSDSGYVWVKKYLGVGCYAMDSIKVINYKTNLLENFISLGKDITKCPGDSIKLSCDNPKAIKYSWNTGVSNKPIFAKQPDTISIKASFGGSCYAVDTMVIKNYKLPEFTLGPDTGVCPKQSIYLGYFPGAFDAYIWNNGSTSAFLTTDTIGRYWLKVKDANGCFQKDTISVSALNTPNVNLGNDTGFCNKSYYILNAKNNSTLNKYKWGTNSTQQTDTAKKTGKYWVRVTNKCGTSIDSINLNFLSKPLVIFPDEIIFCDSLAIELGAANTSNDLKYYWNTKATTPGILIRDTGIYKVIVSNICGKDSASVHVIPCLKYIKIDVAKTCINKPVDFSIPSDLKLDSVKWNFGDTASTSNTSKISPKVSHIYKHFGDYKISLVLFYKGRKDTISASVSFINPKPDFTVSDVCENDSVRFTNKSLELHNLSFYWKFGDGQNSVLVSPAHLYQINGVSQTFNISLVGKASDGCSDSVNHAVTVNANPISDFSIAANYNVVDFKASKTGNTQYKWIFGNGDSAITGNSNYKYTYPNITANYKACLKVSDAAGCFSKTCKDVNISAGILSITKANGFKIYPNPNSGNFTIEIDNPSNDVSIEVCNLLGEKVGIVGMVEKVNTINLDVANGIYLIKVKNGGLVYYQKVSISK